MGKKVVKIPDGTIGPMTKNRLSLAAALGYSVNIINRDTIHIFQKKRGNGQRSIEDFGEIRREDLFIWLSERHPIDYAQDFGSYDYKLRYGQIE